MWVGRAIRQLLMAAVTVLLGGLFAATLVRMAPGFSADEQQLDSRLNADSIAALRAARQNQRNIARFYLAYVGQALHGDLGNSQMLNRPVRQLIAERLPATLRLVTVGLGLGWTLALAMALTAAMLQMASYDAFATVVCAALLCIPSAVLALLFVYASAPPYLAIALVVFPRIFRYTRNLLAKSYHMPHIITARAKGLRETRILFWHVMPAAGAPMLALAGVSVSMALGAAIPVEALCGIPGIGQLAWQAALGRDLPLLIALTVLVTVITMLANSGSEVAGQAFRPRPA